MFQQGFYQGAVQRFQQAIEQNPRSADAYYNLGAVYHQLAKLGDQRDYVQQAEGLYNQALQRDPNHNDSHRALAVLLVEQGRSDEAYRLLESWAMRAPTLSAPRVELARISEEFGDKESARRYLQDALAANPNDPRALAALGRLHEQLGDTFQALRDYERSLWNDRFQPEVAARVAALRQAVGPQPLAPGTRTAALPGAPGSFASPAAPASPSWR
jgi:tetratricopeptide (TPR) repeat protein